MGVYDQPEKQKARDILISHAIKSLTKNRFKNTIVTKEHFAYTVYYFCNLINNYTKLEADTMSVGDLIVEKWFQIFSSKIRSTKPSDLKVLYLAGPEPNNDLELLISNGISYHNIWAIEGDKKTFEKAVGNLRSNNNLIKIHKGSLKSFFQFFTETFDIVYFDACTPIISSTKNPLDVLKELFINRRLNQFSALITNFSEPKVDDYNEWAKVLACWFAPRYDDVPRSTHKDLFSDVESRYIYLEDYADFLLERIPEYYSEFIPRFISVFASEMIPFWKMISFETLQQKYFWNDDKLNYLLKQINKPKISGNTVKEIFTNTPQHILAPSAYPLISWTQLSSRYLAKSHPLNEFFNSKRNKRRFADAIIISDILKKFEEGYSGFKTYVKELCSDQLRDVLEQSDFFDKYLNLTVDIPMKNLLIELIIGLYTFPYINNASAHKSIKYKASGKKTWMYSDVFIFDQCRYMYDILPSLELTKEFAKTENWPIQVLIRCCIDEIKRKYGPFDSNLFRGGSVAELYSEEISSIVSLSNRLNLNKNMSTKITPS